MENSLYQRYLRDPAVREEIEATVRELRAATFDQYLFQPILRLLRRTLRLGRGQPRTPPSPALALSRGGAIQATLCRGESLRVDDALGYEVRLIEGCLWITQDLDSSDYVLGAGQTFRISRNGATLAQAMEGASLQIAYRAEANRPGRPASAPARPIGAGWAGTQLAVSAAGATGAR
jgi:hypothetical protein